MNRFVIAPRWIAPVAGGQRVLLDHGVVVEAGQIGAIAPLATLRAAGVTLMIHGHTHRPARHDFVLDYTPAQRFVLSDWDYDATPVRGGYIRFAGGAPVAEDF